MFKVIPYNTDLDLTEFYSIADSKGYTNNSTKKMLVDSLSNETEYNVWILYYKEKAIGSVAAHSFPEMGDNAYRIACRTCVFAEYIDGVYGTALRTKSIITHYQNPTSQFLIPTCIEWAPKNSNLYITSNENSVGTQRKVHKIFAPLMEKQGVMKRIKEINYRGTTQTVWQLFPDLYYTNLNKYPRW